MPLSNYGVAIGTYVNFQRDPQDAYGHWYHGHLRIATPAGEYESALDVDTPSGVGVSFKLVTPSDASKFANVQALANGWHPLTSNDSSGALDYLRSELLLGHCSSGPSGISATPRPWYLRPYLFLNSNLRYLLCLLTRHLRGWQSSSGDNALTALEQVLPGCHRIYLFGQHYTSGLGVHDVHMNQGDPANTQWYATDGIWQDGGVIVEKADGTLVAWLVRFNSQSMNTDSHGHPV